MNPILDPERLLAALAIATAWIVWTLHVLRRARRARVAADGTTAGKALEATSGEAAAHEPRSAHPAWVGRAAIVPGASAAPLLVAVASQTGVAAALASRTAQGLCAAGVAARVESLGQIDESALRRAGRALFVVSTCGEGDAPDEAFGFVRRMSEPGAGLDGFGFALLALGDSSYANFCAFGRRLESWLLERGAAPLWERIDVDGADTAALRRWDEALTALAEADTAVRAVARSGAFATEDAGSAGPDAEVDSLTAAGIDPVFADGSTFLPWRLVSREPMNPGSVGEPILRLAFEPVETPDARPATLNTATLNAAATGKPAATAKAAAGDKAATASKAGSSTAPGWQPGDLARLRIPVDGATVLRDYSIASLPDEHRIELFVRLQRDEVGRLGLASGWLSGIDISGLKPGGTVALTPRANPGFRLAVERDNPLILIGSGSGLAGLRALLRARERAGAGPNWLIFGERNEAHDFLCSDEVRAWQANGVLEHFDGVFSRDGATRRYVQHRLVERAATLRRWIEAGAAVHVCGSRERLAVGVDAALARILGDEAFARLRESGRYRRDVW